MDRRKTLLSCHSVVLVKHHYNMLSTKVNPAETFSDDDDDDDPQHPMASSLNTYGGDKTTTLKLYNMYHWLPLFSFPIFLSQTFDYLSQEQNLRFRSEGRNRKIHQMNLVRYFEDVDEDYMVTFYLCPASWSQNDAN